MNAVVLERKCSPEEMKIIEIDIPKVKPGWVLVKVKAFGLNSSEKILRNIEIERDYIKKPIVPGIECVGIIENPSDSKKLKKGDKICALMGGMGRSFDGSYEEYALLPEDIVFKVNSDLSFDKLAAIPETFFTGYSSLFDCMQIKKGDIVLIEAGTSALGIASIQMAKAIGAEVLTTITNEKYTDFVKQIGADKVYITKGDNLYELVSKDYPDGINKMLDLVGEKTIKQGINLLQYHGIICSTGVLGGMNFMQDFYPLKDLAVGKYLTGFTSNYPFQEKIDEIFEFIKKYDIKPYIGETFKFEDISKAHRNLEEHTVIGKMVVMID